MNRQFLKSASFTAAFFFALALGNAQTQIIPQIADGGGWQTTIVLTNTSASAAAASLTFYQETSGGATQNWNLAFLEGTSTQNISLPSGGTLFLHTPGVASITSVGWAQLQASAAVTAYAIFTQRVPGRQDQDGTTNAASAVSRMLVPYDNTGGFVTSVAIANPSASDESISVAIQPTSGASSQLTPITLPAQGHTAFALPQQFSATGGQSGLLELYSASGSFSGLALRFNPTGAFTTSPAYSETGSPIIVSAGSSTGGGGTLPVFSAIAVTASGPNLPNVAISLVGGGGIYVSGAASGVSSGLAASVGWNNVTVSGQTFTFSGPVVSSSFMEDTGNSNRAGITSASLTFTLSPQAVNTSGTATGSLTFVSTLGTVSGSFTGTYRAAAF